METSTFPPEQEIWRFERFHRSTMTGNEKSTISNVIYNDKDNLGPISHARRARTAYNLHECVMTRRASSPVAHSGRSRVMEGNKN